MDNNKPLSKPSLTRALINLEIALIDLSSREAREYIEKAIKDIETIKKLNAELLNACRQAETFIIRLKLGIKKTYSILVSLNEAMKNNLPESQHISNCIDTD